MVFVQSYMIFDEISTKMTNLFKKYKNRNNKNNINSSNNTNSNYSNSVRGAPWSADNRLNGHRNEAFSWRPIVRPSQEGQPIPPRPYPELRTCHQYLRLALGKYSDMRPTHPVFVPHAYQPPPLSLPSPNPPQLLLNTPMYQL